MSAPDDLGSALDSSSEFGEPSGVQDQDAVTMTVPAPGTALLGLAA